MEQTIKITADGEVFFLYDDESPLRDLGDLKVARASNIFFDHELQRWKIRVNMGKGTSVIIEPGYRNRADAIRAEIECLELMLRTDRLKPESIF